LLSQLCHCGGYRVVVVVVVEWSFLPPSPPLLLPSDFQ
jgi:hypothetical protein